MCIHFLKLFLEYLCFAMPWIIPILFPHNQTLKVPVQWLKGCKWGRVWIISFIMGGCQKSFSLSVNLCLSFLLSHFSDQVLLGQTHIFQQELFWVFLEIEYLVIAFFLQKYEQEDHDGTEMLTWGNWIQTAFKHKRQIKSYEIYVWGPIINNKSQLINTTLVNWYINDNLWPISSTEFIQRSCQGRMIHFPI